jgi:hypothetical protein
VAYHLLDGSWVEIGCQDPCACPISIRGPLTGTFTLSRAGSDGLFEYYNATAVDWAVPPGTLPLRYTGNGVYKVGGEFAVQHQLTLDLTTNGQFQQRFDSGLVPGGHSFPVIEIRVAAHGFACFDSVLNLHAAPATAGTMQAKRRDLKAWPNPFRTSIHIEIDLEHAGSVDLVVFDLQGRVVRDLMRGRWVPGGRFSASWDGLASGGAHAPPGMYYVDLRFGGRKRTNPILLLR